MTLAHAYRWAACGGLILTLAGCKSGVTERPPIQGPWGYAEFYFDPKTLFQPNVRIYEVLGGKEQYVEMVRFVGFQNAAGIRCSAGQHTFVLRVGSGFQRITVNVEPGKTTPIRVRAAIVSGVPARDLGAGVLWRLAPEQPIAFEEKH